MIAAKTDIMTENLLQFRMLFGLLMQGRLKFKCNKKVIEAKKALTAKNEFIAKNSIIDNSL